MSGKCGICGASGKIHKHHDHISDLISLSKIAGIAEANIDLVIRKFSFPVSMLCEKCNSYDVQMKNRVLSDVFYGSYRSFLSFRPEDIIQHKLSSELNPTAKEYYFQKKEGMLIIASWLIDVDLKGNLSKLIKGKYTPAKSILKSAEFLMSRSRAGGKSPIFSYDYIDEIAKRKGVALCSCMYCGKKIISTFKVKYNSKKTLNLPITQFYYQDVQNGTQYICFSCFRKISSELREMGIHSHTALGCGVDGGAMWRLFSAIRSGGKHAVSGEDLEFLQAITDNRVDNLDFYPLNFTSLCDFKPKVKYERQEELNFPPDQFCFFRY